MSEYEAEIFAGLIIGISYVLIEAYRHATKRRLYNKVAEILAKP